MFVFWGYLISSKNLNFRHMKDRVLQLTLRDIFNNVSLHQQEVSILHLKLTQ